MSPMMAEKLGSLAVAKGMQDLFGAQFQQIR